MQLSFFSRSMQDSYDTRAKEMRMYVRGLPVTDFELAERSQMCEMLVAKFGFPEMPEFATGQIEIVEPEYRQGQSSAEITVRFPYKGDATLFCLFHTFSPIPAPSFECKDGMLLKRYRLPKQHVDIIDAKIDADVKHVEEYSKPVRAIAPVFNNNLLAVAETLFDERLDELNENKQANSALAKSKYIVRKRADAAENVVVPVQRQPMQVTRAAANIDPIREYVMSLAEYEDILKTIGSMAKVMERTPSVFAAMNEEPLRTILLVALNGLYEGQATGETFNGAGKTDILIRRDDRNVFIAECLMWRGPDYLAKKMDDQLFKYAMWRDSKLALIIFNRGGKFTHVIDTMKATVKNHPQCVNQMNWHHESGARYLFRRHDDPSRNFVLTALAFDVPSDAQQGNN